MKQRHTILAFAAGIAMLAATPAQAVLTTYFGEDLNPGGTVPAGGNAATAQANFLSGLSSGVGTENFEGQTTGSTGGSLALTFPGSTGNITATLGGTATIFDAPGAGRFATSGSKYLETAGGAGFNITFSAPVAAFGFFGTDIGDFNGQLILTLANGGGTQAINVGNTINAPNGSLLYFGFIDDANTYSSLSFTNTSGSDYFGFDDMTIGDLAQVQVPDGGASVALLGLALGALGFIRRRLIA